MLREEKMESHKRLIKSTLGRKRVKGRTHLVLKWRKKIDMKDASVT